MPVPTDTTTTRPTAAAERTHRPLPQTLVRSTTLRSWIPEDLGGGPGTVRAVSEALVDLGAQDADLGWIGAVAAVTNLAVADFPERTRREVWSAGHDTLVSGTLAPQGTGTRVGADLRVDAVSAPASGLPWADWVMATVLDRDAGALVRVLVPVDEVRVEATWDAAGLRGTGGDTAHLEGVVVPAHRTRVLVPTPASAPLTFSATLFFAAPLVGAVTAARDRVLREAQAGGARWDRPDVRAALAEAVRAVARAEALTAAAVRGLGTRADVDARTPLERAVVADLAVRAVGEAEAALPLLVSASGAAALHADHPLARTVRDVGVGARHTALSPTKAALAVQDAVSAA